MRVGLLAALATTGLACGGAPSLVPARPGPVAEPAEPVHRGPLAHELASLPAGDAFAGACLKGDVTCSSEDSMAVTMVWTSVSSLQASHATKSADTASVPGG